MFGTFLFFIPGDVTQGYHYKYVFIRLTDPTWISPAWASWFLSHCPLTLVHVLCWPDKVFFETSMWLWQFSAEKFHFLQGEAGPSIRIIPGHPSVGTSAPWWPTWAFNATFSILFPAGMCLVCLSLPLPFKFQLSSLLRWRAPWLSKTELSNFLLRSGRVRVLVIHHYFYLWLYTPWGLSHVLCVSDSWGPRA